MAQAALDGALAIHYYLASSKGEEIISMASTTYKYRCIEVQQTPQAKPFYVASVPAEDILKWADVPRKKEHFMAGYQRTLDEGRQNKIREFFEADEAHNIIPSAVIIALKSGAVTRTQLEPGIFEIAIEAKDFDLTDAIKIVAREFVGRLSDEEKAAVAIDVDEEDVGEEEEDDETPPLSYLSILARELKKADEKGIDSIESPMKEALVEHVHGVVKPGLIIDGQHRVFGAKDVSAFSVKLPVVLLPDLDHQEQVFHFYVLNNKAKPLTPTELRTTVSTSLSSKEIDSLYVRFKKVGVVAEQAEWTHRMNNDVESPFRGLINMGLNKTSGIISENVAYQVISKFVKMGRKYKPLTDKIAEWNSQDPWAYRMKCFYALWSAVKAQYPAAWQTAVDGTSKQILQKVSLINLQEFLLDSLNNEMPRRTSKGEKSPFADPDTLREEAGYSLAYLKEEFFTKEWKIRGLDTSLGHQQFRRAIDTAVANQSANLGNMALFRTPAQ